MHEASSAAVHVNAASEADIAAVGTFLRTAWQEAGPDAPGFAGATDDIIEEIAAPEAVQARIGGPDHRMFLARAGDDVVGFAATRRVDQDTVELAGIIVSGSWSGRGVGTALIEAAVGGSLDDAYRTMVVRTETDNERALAFYEANGFRRGRIDVEQVDDVTVDVWELSRPLGDATAR